MLDLNNPTDARLYVLSWVEQASDIIEDEAEVYECTDEEALRLAKQLFLYCDPRRVAGGVQ